MSEETVTWVTGRLLAVARGLALEVSRARGKSWALMTREDRQAAVAEAELVVSGWVSREVVVPYEAPHMEPAGGGEPMVDWSPRGAVDT